MLLEVSCHLDRHRITENCRRVWAGETLKLISLLPHHTFHCSRSLQALSNLASSQEGSGYHSCSSPLFSGGFFPFLAVICSLESEVLKILSAQPRDRPGAEGLGVPRLCPDTQEAGEVPAWQHSRDLGQCWSNTVRGGHCCAGLQLLTLPRAGPCLQGEAAGKAQRRERGNVRVSGVPSQPGVPLPWLWASCCLGISLGPAWCGVVCSLPVSPAVPRWVCWVGAWQGLAGL